MRALLMLVCVVPASAQQAYTGLRMERNALIENRERLEGLGVESGTLTREFACESRVNIEACLGTRLNKNHVSGVCEWGDGTCGKRGHRAPMCCTTDNCAGDADAQAKCKGFRFRSTCTQWATAMGPEACGEGEDVVVWGDNDPKDYSSYRGSRGERCADSTCDTREQCCYVKKSYANREIETCDNYLLKYPNLCEEKGKIQHKIDRQCNKCYKDCCADTCYESQGVGKHYCPASKGMLFPDDVLKTIRCATPDRYGRKDKWGDDAIECGDDECCDPPVTSESKYTFDSNNLQDAWINWKVPGAVVACGAVISAIAIVARRPRAHNNPEEELLSAEE